MTCLLLDIGNSRLKWATSQNKMDISAQTCFDYRQDDLLQYAEHVWSDILVDSIWISSVAAPSVYHSIYAWFKHKFGVEALLLRTPKQGVSVRLAYDVPEKLGSDRWAGMEAAYAVSHDAVLVVSCGTAITLDVVDRQGMHKGGYICPGIGLMQNAVQAGTSAIKNVVADFLEAPYLGTTTDSCVQSGVLMAVISLIRSTWNQARDEMNLQPVLWITGGDAEYIVSHLVGLPVRYDPALVLNGVALIAASNYSDRVNK